MPFDQAFTGFSDDIVIIVGSALLVSAAVARSGVAERLIAPLAPYLTTTRAQVVVLTGAVALLSAFVKNVGALAIFMPIAFQLARRAGTSPSRLLMPMAFGALLGGIVTLIGTSPNVIVSRMRAELLGEPFRMFDFAPVGAGIALAGLVFLAFGHRLLPERKGAASIDAAFNIEGYTTEALLPEGSSAAGKTVAELEALSEGDVTVTSIIRERFRRYTPAADWTLYPDDALLLQGEPAALERLVARAGLQLVTEDKAPDAEAEADDVGVMEAVVTADSDLVDRSPTQLSLRGRYQINLLAVSRSGERIVQRLRFIRFRPGDVIALQGNLKTLPDTLGELRLLPLAARSMPLGRSRRGFLAVAVLVLAMALVTAGIVPVQIGFFGAATFILLLRLIPLREAYEVVEWPILILLGALIPVSEAVRTTGGTELIAGWLSVAADALPPMGALALILVAAMAVTPFLNNAATVLVMAPIAASFAAKLEPQPRPVPDGRRHRCGLRLPHPHRPPVQHAGHGPRRLPLRRLCAPGPAALAPGDRPGHGADRTRLAAQGGIAPPRLLRAETLPFTP